LTSATEAVADAEREHHAVGTAAELAAVVGLGARIPGLAGAVTVLHVVERVVVIVEKVPAGDVVHEAVAVGVAAVGEAMIRSWGVITPAGPARRGSLRSTGNPVVVVDVEDPVAVAVVVRAVLGLRQLALV